MSAITSNAAEFIKANARSRVVSGSVIGLGGQGATFTLANGRTFELTAEECKQVAPVKWKGQDQ